MYRIFRSFPHEWEKSCRSRKKYGTEPEKNSVAGAGSLGWEGRESLARMAVLAGLGQGQGRAGGAGDVRVPT